MSKNTNRDYLIIVDVKSSTIREFNKLEFYINDKESHNIFVQLVIKESHDIINKYVPIDDPNLYELAMNIVKPTNEHKRITGKLISLEDGLYEFKLPKDCCDKVGTYKCELETKYNSRITNSNNIKYRIKKSVLNNLDNIVDAPGYPIVIQLLDKLSDIEQYEENRRTNELARQLAEQQRQARFNALDADMVNSIEAMDNKVIEVENRISAKEQAVDKLINDTKADIDDYKVAKDQEIDDYKSLKDTEINNAITNQDNKIDTAISEQNDRISNAIATQDNKIDTAIKSQNDRIAVVENNDVVQDNRLDVLENKDVLHESRLDAIEVKNQQQDNRLDIVENKNTQQDNRLNDIEAKNVEQDNRLNEIEAIDVSQNNRLDAIEVKNQQQDDRLLDIEKVNNRQDIDIKCLYGASQTIDVTKEGNSIYLQNSNNGFTIVDEIKGNTLVNCNKEPDKELILNGNINTSGDRAVTITEGVDGGLVDVALEGNTMVNVCDQKDPVAITKNYTVETGNHVALQGEYDGNCRPVVTGNTLVNILQKREPIDLNKTNNTGTILLVTPNKLNTEYTMIINLSNLNLDGQSDIGMVIRGVLIDGTFTATSLDSTMIKDNVIKLKWIETEKQFKGVLIGISGSANANNPTFTLENVMILEGDYSDKPIPKYFEGLQSSFEDKVVTQEMVDNGEEEAENLGKYKVDYVVTGKNLFDKNIGVTQGYINQYGIYHSDDVTSKTTDYIKVFPNTTYTTNNTTNEFTHFYDGDKNRINYVNTATFITPSNCYYARCTIKTPDFENDFQLEEGTVATPYEPYKEYKKTFYLNSPLLEGDTIEQQGDNVVHVHRYEKVVSDGSSDEKWQINGNGNNTHKYFIRVGLPSASKSNCPLLCDKLPTVTYGDLDNGLKYGVNQAYGIRINTSEVDANNGATVDEFRAWLQANPVSVVYELKTPQYEVISQNDTILCDSYVNGHLDFDTAVPVEKVEFNGFGFDIKYLYPSTNYTVQFEADNNGKLDVIAINSIDGASNIAVKKGINKFNLTISPTITNQFMWISGIGFNASNIVVTEATDQEFGYFEGMKSVGECEGNKIEILSRYHYIDYYSNNNSGHHVKPIWNFSTKSISGYLQYFNEVPSYYQCNNLFDFYYIGGNSSLWINLGSFDPYEAFETLNIRIAEGEGKINKKEMTHEPLRAVGDIKDRYVLIDGKWYIERNCGEVVLDGSEDEKWSGYKEKDNTIFMENQLRLLNKATIIADKIPTSTNDDIYDLDNELIFVNATGAIQLNLTKSKLSSLDASGFKSYLQSNPITVIYELASPTYEPIDYNPFTVYSDTTHISNNSTIPCNMTIKNTGFNCLLKPNTTYTVSSNLGLNTVTTPSTLIEDCLRFYDTDTSDVTTMKDVLVLEGDWTSKADLIPANFSGIESAFEQEYDVEKGKYKVNVKIANEDKTKENNITFYINEPLRGVATAKDRVYVKDDKVVVERNCGARKYQDGDFGTYITDKIDTVYQLAEPVYEEVEYNDTKLFIESFKNSTLFYNSNVPVTSKLYYSYSVPIVDTVAQTANISDQQDVMIIDLATQVAVMEMLLM